jgi:nucleoid-associated protein YgaU
MVNRYDSTNTRTLGRGDIRPQGVEVYTSLLPVKVQPEDDDAIIVAGDGDRLDQLAYKFYGSPVLWFVLASVNNINGSMHVKPGTILRIPSIHRIVG